MSMKKHIRVKYYACLREQAGRSEESLVTELSDLKRLYEYLRNAHRFTQDIAALRVSVNSRIVAWEKEIQDGDEVFFIPPVAGG